MRDVMILEFLAAEVAAGIPSSNALLDDIDRTAKPSSNPPHAEAEIGSYFTGLTF